VREPCIVKTCFNFERQVVLCSYKIAYVVLQEAPQLGHTRQARAKEVIRRTHGEAGEPRLEGMGPSIRLTREACHGERRAKVEDTCQAAAGCRTSEDSNGCLCGLSGGLVR
jgi:hypothetical protein